MKATVGVVLCGLILGFTPPIAAQQAPATPTYETALYNSWKGLHDKILTMAKDTVFPDAKLGWIRWSRASPSRCSSGGWIIRASTTASSCRTIG